MFASKSQARIMQTHYDLATMKKSSLSMADYFQKAQHMSHILAIVGEPMKDLELISYVLAGLTTEYDFLVTSIIGDYVICYEKHSTTKYNFFFY